MKSWMPYRFVSTSTLSGIATAFAVVLVAARVYAHEGPPYPIVTDAPIGTMMASVWTDPDIGTGTFYIVLEPTDGNELPKNITVQIGVTPKSGRLTEAVYHAEPQRVRYGARFFAEVAFDQGEWWDVRVTVESPSGSGILTAEVEATPDGQIGPISLVVYAVPFLALGGLWLKAALRKRRPDPDRNVERHSQEPTTIQESGLRR